MIGVGAAPLIGLGAGALVPSAVSFFGTVVLGIGTIHASLAAGGVAAILQATSAAFMSCGAVAVGVAIGGVAGALTGKGKHWRQHQQENQAKQS